MVEHALTRRKLERDLVPCLCKTLSAYWTFKKTDYSSVFSDIQTKSEYMYMCQ